MDGGLQPSLVPVLELSDVVQELDHHGRVLVVDVLLFNLALQFLAKLVAGQRPVDEGCWFFLIKFIQLFAA